MNQLPSNPKLAIWHAVYTRGRHEKKVYTQLLDKGIEAYCPTRMVMRQWSDRKKKVEEVLFRSYVFVKVNPQEFLPVLETPGVTRFVYYLGKPAVITQEEIDTIKRFLEETTDYSISFQKNDEVMITEGALAGRTGIIEQLGKNRLRIRIQQLGISLLAEVHRNKVEKK